MPGMGPGPPALCWPLSRSVPGWGGLASRLLALQVVLLSLALSSAMGTGCHHNRTAYTPSTVAMPTAALYELGTSGYNATLCLFTFSQLQDAYQNSVPCYSLLPVMLITCPQHCLRALDTSPSPLVLGSYPYHPSSSACLSAIHAGIVTNEAGGGVLAERFYPESWDEDSTQSIFPHGSHLPSLSNGVQTAAVPADAMRTPAPLDSFSWTVRSRGLSSGQRQRAPFSPRAGHTHLVLPQQQLGIVSQQLIVGGHNASHYFNDVYLFQTFNERDTVLSSQTRNGRWLRLPDAPFSPRSEMAAHWIPLASDRDAFRNYYPISNASALLFYGGQTGDSCGNRVLGQCSDEVWQLTLTFVDQSSGPDVSTLGLSLTWSPAPIGRLTFGARCGMSVIADQRWLTTGQLRIVGLAGGQLSYTDTERCSEPIDSRNDVWYSVWPDLFHWQAGSSAPFSSRRSMQVDDAYYNSDDDYFDSEYYRNYIPLAKTVSLAGGIRYISHRVDNLTGKAVITRAEMYSDVYSCTLPTPEYEPAGAALDCDWAHSWPLSNASVAPPYAPTGSLPLPAAYGASTITPSAYFNSLVRFGGASSQAALAAWLSTTPTGAADAFNPVDWSLAPSNVSTIAQPLFMNGVAAAAAAGGLAVGGLSEIMPARHHLPLSYILDETELNSGTSDFTLGSAAVVTHLLPLDLNKLQPHTSTLHLQPVQMVQTPAEATDFVPQAASALNTTRPAFAFSMRRRGHTQQVSLDTTYVVGGQSGQQYSNDFISSRAQGCLWPRDPSYRSLLGPLSTVAELTDTNWVLQRHGKASNDFTFLTLFDLPLFPPYTTVRLQCAAEHHFSPPAQGSSAVFTCTGAGLWLDLSLGAVRRCVPDLLKCDWPFVDAGVGHCVDPEPELSGVQLRIVTGFSQTAWPAYNIDNGTVVLPAQWYPALRHQQLYVFGRWLATPLSIAVLDFDCQQPMLHNATRYCTADRQLCRDFASAASCTMRPFMDALYNDRLPIVVTVGRRQRVFSFIQPPAKAFIPSQFSLPMSIHIAPPSIARLSADECSLNSTALELVDCPADRAFDMHVCVDNLPLYVNNGEPPRLSLSSGAQLECKEWGRELLLETERVCVDRLVHLPCWQTFVCSTCRVLPLIGAGHVLRIVLPNGLTNEVQVLASNSTPRVSFAACRPGSRAELMVSVNDSSMSLSQLCIECMPGYSTLGLSDQRSCTPCAPGSYASHNGSAVCALCPLGHAASRQNSTECAPCGANSWARYEGAQECNECGDAQYKRLPPQLNSSAALHELPSCEPCPSGAQCERNGSILALQGYFLTIDNRTGAVSSVLCGLSSCVDVAADEQCRLAAASFADPDSQSAVQRIGSTGPAVLNCCGANRQPPVDAAGNVNVLCAACIEGYSVVHAECIPCSSVHWAPLCGLLLFAALLTYVLHRLFNDATGSATMPILAYFVQMSTLFLAQDALPMLLSLASVDLVAEGGAGGAPGGGGGDLLRTCIVPLDDIGKMLTRLLSPAVFCALLAALLGLQFALRAAINTGLGQRSPAQSQDSAVVKAYRLLLPAVADSQLLEHSSPAAGLHSPSDGVIWSGVLSLQAKRTSPSGKLRQELSEPLVMRSSQAVEEEAEAEPAPALPASTACVTGDSVRGILIFYLRTLVRLALYSYNTVTLVSLAAFRTIDVGDFGSRLQQYPSVNTAEAEYRAMSVLFIFMLVVVVAGSPIALSLYLTHCYRQGFVGRSEDNAGPAGRGPRASDSIALVLTASFQPRFWWYPVVILLRRLVLIVVLTFVQRGVYSWLTILNYLFLTLHLLLWPYAHARDSALELLTALALTTQTGVISAYSTPESRPSWVGGLLWLLFVLPFGVGVATALWARYAHLVQGGCCCRGLFGEPEPSESPAQQELANDGLGDL